MKKKSIALLIMICASVLYGTESSIDIPLMAFKILAESTVEKCPTCVYTMQKQAFKMIDAVFVPGKTIASGKEFTFIRNDTCEYGELLISTYKERIPISEEPGKEGPYLPLMTFNFHTGRHHLAGVKSQHFSPDTIDTVYGEPDDGKVRHFSGKIVLIPSNYGNGKAFIYFVKTNKIQVQCLVTELKALD